MLALKEENNNEITNAKTDNTLDEIIQGKSNSKNNLSDKNKKEKSDYCKELKNIAYKTMLLNGQEIVPDVNNTNNNTLSKYLENESSANQKKVGTN